MSLTSRRKRPLDRTIAVRDARLVVIATEGEKTEEMYFSIFRSSKIQVRVIPCPDGRSAPEHVYNRLLEFREQFQLGDGDELWLAIDRDRWPPKALKKIGQCCFSGNIGLALSNPCFEIWLSMHYMKAEKFPEKLSSSAALSLFRDCHGAYNKAKFDASSLLPKVNLAIDTARELDRQPTERWPNKVGSRVYRLVESIQKRR